MYHVLGTKSSKHVDGPVTNVVTPDLFPIVEVVLHLHAIVVAFVDQVLPEFWANVCRTVNVNRSTRLVIATKFSNLVAVDVKNLVIQVNDAQRSASLDVSVSRALFASRRNVFATKFVERKSFLNVD